MTSKVKTILAIYGVFFFALIFSAMAYVTVKGPGMPLVAWFTLMIVGTVAATYACIASDSGD